MRSSNLELPDSAIDECSDTIKMSSRMPETDPPTCPVDGLPVPRPSQSVHSLQSMETLMRAAEDSAEVEDVVQRCPRCGSTKLREALLKSTFWHDARLVVVDNIPAIVCESCGERFLGNATSATLDLMRERGFPVDEATSHMHVAVFSFSHRIPAELVEVAETQE